MDIIEVTSSEYKKLVSTPFSVFDSTAFAALNASKVDEVKYLVFNDGKNRFGLIAGIKDGVLKAPYSAPYACFSEIGKKSKIASYSGTASALVAYGKKNNLSKIRITFPPTVYDESHIAKFYNSFYIAGFKIAGCDLNYQYDLDQFGDNYEMKIDPKARQKLRASLKNGLTFEPTDDIESVYHIIAENRKAKNFPLLMTLDDIRKTIEVIKADFYLVRKEDGQAIASAIVYEVASDKVQVIYWGNLPGTDSSKSMNFLSYHLFDVYKKANKTFFDIGPSTENSIPNVGLCDFKQTIGCDTSTKLTFELDL